MPTTQRWRMAERDFPTIWIEVDDFIRYFDGSVTPTGISRVQSEILAFLAADQGSRVRFCRIGTSARHVEILDWEEVRRATDGNAFLRRRQGAGPLFRFARVARWMRRRLGVALRAAFPGARTLAFREAVRPGDVLVNLGASWTHSNFPDTVGQLKRELGLSFALLVHDVLPVSHPQFCNPKDLPAFARWLSGMAGVWDVVMTPSRASADALTRHLEAGGLKAPPIHVVPFGAGFGLAKAAPAGEAGERRDHVLYVSTIEIRKNHTLLVDVWEELIRRHGADCVPTLVFAGKYGWQIEDLRRRLTQNAFFGGKIRVVGNLSDEGLSALYRDSLFTMFPSHCEGWGLPVAESLVHGRLCIASNATSIPEVGGPFALYHDPLDVAEACRLVEAALFDGTTRAEQERLIAERYKAPSWRDTAHAVMAVLDAQAGGIVAPLPAAVPRSPSR
jgi:glycosyltransferase involved in cell wall biosynthesis